MDKEWISSEVEYCSFAVSFFWVVVVFPLGEEFNLEIENPV